MKLEGFVYGLDRNLEVEILNVILQACQTDQQRLNPWKELVVSYRTRASEEEIQQQPPLNNLSPDGNAIAIN
jgi:hypothetical protein